MRVEKLELIGFKSFAERTSFNFHRGITCIVGPNGCGKSNIVDAFRWVLGEQSAKSLRGEKMEEVIFNGSASKKPKGMAEVTMVISGLNGNNSPSTPLLKGSEGELLIENGDGVTDVAYVTRRLYRSGDSEYILNKNQCRLKDIKDIFLDTGLGVKSYSILEQDRIAEILNAKPQDRRFLIEEIAGVMKYNVRKKEAIAKLESSRMNLQRINDIIVEVKKQINFLDRLAKKAEKFKRLSSEIGSIELKISKRDYESLKLSLGKILEESNILREEEALKRAELSKIESQTETKRLGLIEKEKTLDLIQTEFQNIEKEIAEIEKFIAVGATERDNYTEYLEKLYQQGEEFHKKHSDALIRQQELYKTKTELSSEIDNQKELLSEKSDFVRYTEEQLLEKEDLLEVKRKEIFRISEELSNLKNEQSKLQSNLESLNHKEASSLKDVETLKKTLSGLDSSLRDLESSLLKKNNELVLLREKREVFTKGNIANNEKIETLREKLSSLKEELASNISRIESLREIVFDESTKDLLSEGTSFNLLASISDVIEVDSEYEKAIESALSEKVNSFILSSLDDIEIAVSAVKEKGLGRTAFIPVNLIPAKEQEELSGEKADVPEGSMGRALGFIRTGEEFAGVAKSLFDNIFIVKDLKTALDLISSGQKLFYATLEGEVIEPSGLVIAGEVKGIFRKKREIKEIEAIIEKHRSMIDRSQSELSSLQQQRERIENDLRNTESTIVEREKEISLLKHTVESTREEKERRNRKLAYLSLEIEQTLREKETVKKLLAEKDYEIRSVNSRRETVEEQSSSLQEEISRRRSDIEEHHSELTEIKLSITSLKERADSINKELENVLKEIDELNQKKEFLAEEMATVKSRILQRETGITTNEEKIKSLVSVADRLKAEISERKGAIETENQELLATEHGLKLLRNQIESISHRIAELDIQRAEHKLKMDTLSEKIRQNYGFDIATIKAEPLTEEEESRLVDLREKIDELGPVNLGTLEEYEELRNRYEFLKTQHEDLIRSTEELEEAIKKINATTRRKLREAFESLRTKFTEVFTILFGGGRAELIMTDENNILETGIDIIAQPPGKKLQNINLLSGGEKALTALSILFASFLIKPSPFYILDEADSGLDEANTEKFAKMLLELSKDTQFIVVTHNRNTMSMADYIYGVTIEEAGVSKVISMQLVEA
ncbi:MAG: chromosome segregation protein SMC [Nitrospirae bacterium]|jgi:chromosome segregation protein|nr:chromosome segregation protein SMC [Nitrospirota bacterium]